MSNKNLFKEAIADAKAVREAALANAKAALEEALTPKLQSMLAAKLNEMEYEEEELEETKKSEEEKMEEGMHPDVTGDTIQDKYRATGAALEEAEEELEEDFDLSEILAELNEDDSEVSEYEELEEAEEEEEEEETEETEEEEEEEVEVKDMTIEDLKDLIKDIVSQEMGDEAPEMEMGAEEPMDMGGEEEMPAAGGDEDEIDLEELLAELDSLDESDELEEAKKKKAKEEKEEINESLEEGLGDLFKSAADWLSDKKDAFIAKTHQSSKPGAVKLTIEDVRACREESIKKFPKVNIITADDRKLAFQKCLQAKGGARTAGLGAAAGGDWDKFEEAKNDELAEAISTINTLRNELNEVNLLNAKLLYVNKIFKAKNLTESQKVKVIASFDKATNVKEAKVVFESLESALTAAPKKAIKESLGFASKAAGVAPNKTIVESNDVIARMQKLANIK